MASNILFGKPLSEYILIQIYFLLSLDIDDLNEVVALLERHKCSKASYHQLGLRLKLSHNTLSVIEQEQTRIDRCFTECLAKWLRKADSVVEDPTLETLQNALRGIGENAVADGINSERIPGKAIMTIIIYYYYLLSYLFVSLSPTLFVYIYHIAL